MTSSLSRGWLDRFKKRYGLSFRRVQSEALSADNDDIDAAMPRLLRIILTYAEKDVCNADEFGLLFRQLPKWTLAKTAVSGHKMEKSRATFLACCNNDGSEKNVVDGDRKCCATASVQKNRAKSGDSIIIRTKKLG